MADPKFVFLVSGKPKKHFDNTFANVAWLRVKELVKIFNRTRKKTGAAVGVTDEVNFVHFRCHFDKGKKKPYPTVEMYTHSFAKERDAPPPEAWTALSDESSFIEWQPVRDQRDSGKVETAVSIVNVYHTVRRAPAKSVLEVSIFAHAFVEGPVLNDTNSSSSVAGRRDPADTDGRSTTDFTDTMGEDPNLELKPYKKGDPPPTGGKGPGNVNAITAFQSAFAPTGTFRVWGCNIQDIVIAVPPEETAARRCLVLSTPRQVIEEAFKRPLKKGGLDKTMLRGKDLPKGSTQIHLDMGAQMKFERNLQSDAFTKFTEDQLLQVHYNAFPAFFKPGSMGGTLQPVIDRSLSEIAKFVTGAMMDSYGFAAAAALTLTPQIFVFAGAPGTSADLDDTTQMHIDPPRIPEAQFFSKITGAPLKDDLSLTQRHYTLMNDAVVLAIMDVHSNGLPDN
jgi:hypothetical protein